MHRLVLECPSFLPRPRWPLSLRSLSCPYFRNVLSLRTARLPPWARRTPTALTLLCVLTSTYDLLLDTHDIDVDGCYDQRRSACAVQPRPRLRCPAACAKALRNPGRPALHRASDESRRLLRYLQGTDKIGQSARLADISSFSRS